MSRSKHLSLSEARKAGKLDRFARETEFQSTDGEAFDELLGAMTPSRPPGAHPQATSRNRAGRAARRRHPESLGVGHPLP